MPTDMTLSIAIASFVFAVIMALIAFAFWLGVLSNRVTNHGGRIKSLEDSDASDGRSRNDLALAFARFEGTVTQQIKGLVDDLDWLRHVSRPNEKPPTRSRGSAQGS